MSRRLTRGFAHREIQMLMNRTSIRRIPRSFSFVLAGELSDDRMFTSKNLTEQSLLLTATLGSTLLTLALVRLSEVNMTELLMEPCSWVWYCQ